MTTSNSRRVFRLSATAALIFCFAAGAAQAEEKLKSIWVKADDLMAQEKYEEAIKLYSIAIELNAEDPDIYNAYFHRGEALLMLNKVKEALADFNKSIALNPSFSTGYKFRGIIYLETNRFTEAVNDYSRFIEIEPESAAGYFYRGIALGQLGNYDKALADFNTSINLNPACASCFFNRYKLYTVMGRDTEADADLKKAQSLDSGYKGEK